MNLEIITPEKNLYKGKIISATFPGTDGSFGILNQHAPIVSTLKKGDITIIDQNNKPTIFTVTGGVVEVSNNNIIVLAE